MADEGIRKGGKIRDGKSRTMKKLRLASTFRVIKSEKVTGEFNVLDKGVLNVRQAHGAFIICCLLRRAKLEPETLFGRNRLNAAKLQWRVEK